MKTRRYPSIILVLVLCLVSCTLDDVRTSSTYDAPLKYMKGVKNIELHARSAEGDIHWNIAVEEGILEVSYSSGVIKDEHLVTVGAGETVVGNGGYRDGNTVKIHLKAIEPVTGKVSFSTGS